jgi:hypothetical protein
MVDIKITWHWATLMIEEVTILIIEKSTSLLTIIDKMILVLLYQEEE